MSDEELYLQATREVDEERKESALWAKVMALSEGDQKIAKYKYIKLRVEQLTIENANQKKKVSEDLTKQVSEDLLRKREEAIPDAIALLENINKIPERTIAGWTINEPDGSRLYLKNDEALIRYSSRFSHGRELTQKNTENDFVLDEEGNIVEPDDRKPFFARLVSGDYGLAKTYWLYGFLVSVIVEIIARVITSPEILIVILVGYTAYIIPVFMGVWRASDKYAGPEVWAVLAKIIVVLNCLLLAVSFIVVVRLLNA